MNRRISKTEPTGSESEPGPPATWLYERDKSGNVLAEQDPRGAFYTIRYTYDELNRQTSVTRPTGTSSQPGTPAVETFTYDEVGNLLVQSHAATGQSGLPYTSRFSYDGLSRVKNSWDAEHNVTEYFYDAHGHVLRQVSYAEDGFSTDRERKFDYDLLGRQTSAIDAEGRETVTHYDEVGNVVEVSGPLRDETGLLYRTTNRYDALNRLRSTTDSEQYTWQYEYDAVGNRTAVIDPRGPYYRTEYTYDALNHLVRLETPSGTPSAPGPAVVDEYVCDAAGNVLEHVDPRGAAFKTASQYDLNGRVTRTTRVAGTVEHPSLLSDSYRYDAVGNLVEHIDPRRGVLDTLRL